MHINGHLAAERVSLRNDSQFGRIAQWPGTALEAQLGRFGQFRSGSRRERRREQDSDSPVNPAEFLQRFNGPWRELCEHLVSRTAQLAPFLDAASVAALWRSARAGRASRRLAYTFIVLLSWLERHRL